MLHRLVGLTVLVISGPPWGAAFWWSGPMDGTPAGAAHAATRSSGPRGAAADNGHRPEARAGGQNGNGPEARAQKPKPVAEGEPPTPPPPEEEKPSATAGWWSGW